MEIHDFFTAVFLERAAGGGLPDAGAACMQGLRGSMEDKHVRGESRSQDAIGSIVSIACLMAFPGVFQVF